MNQPTNVIPTYLDKVIPTGTRHYGVSHLDPYTGEKMTYIPIHDRSGIFMGSLYVPASAIVECLSYYL